MEIIIHKLSHALSSSKTYIVGGYLRDKLLRLNSSDLDLVTFSSIEEVANIITNVLDTHPIFIGPLIKFPIKTNYGTYFIDLTYSTKKNILSDLDHRDFTCNSLALHIKDFPDFKKIIAKEKSFNDIKNKVIRTTEENSLNKDPIRILRAYYQMEKSDFYIPLDTKLKIEKSKHLLPSCKPERIKEELWKILNLKRSHKVLYDMYLDKVLTLLIPQLEEVAKVECFFTLNFLEKSLDKVIKHSPQEGKLKSYLTNSLPIIKLACLLHRHESAGLVYIRGLAKFLKLSNKEKSQLLSLCRAHMLPLQLFNEKELNNKTIYKFFNKYQENSVGILLLSLCDYSATSLNSEGLQRYQSYILNMLDLYYTRADQVVNVKPLLDGNEIQRVLNIPPSPQVGEIKKLLIEQQLSGNIKTKGEAVKYINTTFLSPLLHNNDQ